MIAFVRELRLLPVVLLAAGSLLALKLVGLLADGGYILSDKERGQEATVISQTELRTPPMVAAPATTPATIAPAPSVAQRSWARDNANAQDITGSVPDKKDDKAAAKPAAAPVLPPKAGPDGAVVPLDGARQLSPGERAVLERLQERRQELDARGREIDIRESLLKATEARLEARAAELKDIEARIDAAMHRKDDTEAAKLKGLITMYENMKAKDAAKIFDRLEMRILVEVASQINPRRMSDILSQMSAEAAERLTVELANRASADKTPITPNLPKIEGKPSGS